MNQQVVRRDEQDNNGSAGDPHEIWYRFAGRAIGYVGNNGTLDIDHAASITNRAAAQGSGAFLNGSTSHTSYADFDQSIAPINSYFQGSGVGGYVARAAPRTSRQPTPIVRHASRSPQFSMIGR